jgi:hypothetical protein
VRRGTGRGTGRVRPALPQDRAAEAGAYAFFPQTFVLPSEYRMLVEEFKREGGTWIMKPTGRAQGQGIFLFNKLSQVRQREDSSGGAARLCARGVSGAETRRSAFDQLLRGHKLGPAAAPCVQISDWRRDHTWKPEDEEQAETYLAQRWARESYGGEEILMHVEAPQMKHLCRRFLRLYLPWRPQVRGHPLPGRRQEV